MEFDKNRYVELGVPRISTELLEEMGEINPLRLFVSDNIKTDNPALKIPVNKRMEQWTDYASNMLNSDLEEDLQIERICAQITQSMRKELVLSAAITLDTLVAAAETEGKKELSPRGLIVVPERVANQVIREYEQMEEGSAYLIKGFRRRDPIAYQVIKWLTMTKEIRKVIKITAEELGGLGALQGQINKFQEFYYNALILQDASYRIKDEEKRRN